MLHLSSIRNCPECHSGNVRRSVRWGILETLVLPLFMLRPFRCEKCDCRYFGLFFAARIKKINAAPKAPLLTNPPEECHGRSKSRKASTARALFCHETLDLGAEAMHEPAVEEILLADNAALIERS